MWPREIDWKSLRFGVEIEFIGGAPSDVELLPGWIMALDELQTDERGEESGSELKPPPLAWDERDQIRVMLERLRAQGARANWSCGLHVHVGLEPWGEAILPAMIDAALSSQEALKRLLKTSPHREIFCPPVTPEMRARFLDKPKRAALCHRGRPQSHRCGVNIAAWFDIGTVEIRYANATLEYDELIRTVELCLRFVAVVGAGDTLPSEPTGLAAALGVPADGYPAPEEAPLWHRERMWLEDLLIPAILPEIERLEPGGEVLTVRPTPEGFLVTVERPDNSQAALLFRATPSGITFLPQT